MKPDKPRARLIKQSCLLQLVAFIGYLLAFAGWAWMEGLLLFVVTSCVLAMSAHAGDDRRCDKPREQRNYILRRQRAYQVRGTPTQRLYIGGRKIDIYRDGSAFEKDNRAR